MINAEEHYKKLEKQDNYFAKRDFREWCEQNWMLVSKLDAVKKGVHNFGVALKDTVMIWEETMEEYA